METTNINTQEQTSKVQGFFAQPRAFLSKDGEYLTLTLPGGMLVRKHRNFFLHVLGVPYERKSASKAVAQAVAQ